MAELKSDVFSNKVTDDFFNDFSDHHMKTALAAVLAQNSLKMFRYFPEEDYLIFYDAQLRKDFDIQNFLHHISDVMDFDEVNREKIIRLFREESRGPIEIEGVSKSGETFQKILNVTNISCDDSGRRFLVGTSRDVTFEKSREEALQTRAEHDSLTGLYNHAAGQALINRYLSEKNPYDSCGLLLIDVDYFKTVNDTYGHSFGDTVLKKLAKLLTEFNRPDDVVIRSGGDEFVVFCKNVSYTGLLNRVNAIGEAVRSQSFSEYDYCMTCSIGVCHLPENVSGYSYDQLFDNADWALYQAKKKGRNCYVFCDSLRRYESILKENNDIRADVQSNNPAVTESSIDARYLHNDIISTAFEIFEKTGSFQTAIGQLLEIIGTRFHLDRITVIRTAVSEQRVNRSYQWLSRQAPEVLSSPGSFTKEDFLTLFHSYDEYGTTVLDYDEMDMYSPDARALLMQGDAKTVLFASMYCEGTYVGAISYVVCGAKRRWSPDSRRQFGELTRIISAHMAKELVLNRTSHLLPEYDVLTGLLSFGRFREEAEQRIIGGDVNGYLIIYTDFINFKYFNHRYGYSEGDRLLREFSAYVSKLLEGMTNVFFTRVVADQFVLLRPYDYQMDPETYVHLHNQRMQQEFSGRYPKTDLHLRSGIYIIREGCPGASEAIDAANYARKLIRLGNRCSAKVYDETLDIRQKTENEILNDMNRAFAQEEFKVYLQPRFSLIDNSILGAEALVRWQRPDGHLIYPDTFIPVYEENGRIIDLDFYVFEKVVQYLAKNNRLGRRQVPISINASALHAQSPDTVERYLEILKRYNVDPSLTEIELTETATVSAYDNVRTLFCRLHNANMMTALDDFGAGYSILNAMIDIPFNTVKVDRVFVEECTTNKKGAFFLKQLLRLFNGLGCRVVCEGAETDEQISLLREAGCIEAQGHWFSKAVPMEEFEKMLYTE